MAKTATPNLWGAARVAVRALREVITRELAEGHPLTATYDRKRSPAALLPLGRTDVLGRPWYGLFELSLWMTLPTTRRVCSGGSSC